MKRDILLCIAVAVSVVASYAAYVSAIDAKRDDIYFLFVHVPAALICFLAFFISLIASIMYLAKRRDRYDRIAEVSAILGLVYGAVALIVGSIWAKVAWNAYWNWDPKQTTMLMLWIAYMGYISIKLSIGSIEKKAVIGAVYNILAFSTIPLTFLSVTLWQSLHPQVSEISTSPLVHAVLYLNLIACSLIFIYLLITAFTILSLEDRVNALIYEKREIEGGV
ncbi:MAG: cytochrome c biogenesis protein CcsA [Euryarchaeota archaeon]|nr:cytochrome c biogenesis protein CcsA [Euryarchaeota archaeon]